ncbi:MAG: DNA helicase [Lentimicrobiaceae bacterium]|nr:DNA helicase [Lentimicrobiaceae bacterium]
MENENIPLELEGLRLDADNKEFNKAIDCILNTDKTIYLTGKAGTGKTTFLKYLKKVTHKRMVVLAPTGVAAINASGETIHSFFHIRPSVYIPEDPLRTADSELNELSMKSIFKHLKYSKSKVELIRNLEAIAIDEVSMVRCDIMDVIDKILRLYRDSTKPFGGVQMILVGDAYQLPPIVKKEEQEILKSSYDGIFFFDSKVMEQIINNNQLIYVELQKVYRQNDSKFIELLDRVRVNDMQDKDFALFDSKINKDKFTNENKSHIILTTTNVKVNYINEKRLAALPTQSKVYNAVVTGTFAEKERPTDIALELKVGAQIIFIRNDKENRYYNGKLGVVKHLGEKFLLIETETNNGEKIDVTVHPETWKSVSYKWNKTENVIEEEILGTFMQLPVRLAWAITVHKSQGMSFDRVMADLGNSFETGQVYVALSRCRSLEGLLLSSKIKPQSIIADPRVIEFSKNMSEYYAAEDVMLINQTEKIDEKAKLYSEIIELKKYIKELEYFKSQQVELYGYDTVSSLRRKNRIKENEYQDEIARLNVKNRELKEKIKKLENKESEKTAAELKKEAAAEKARQKQEAAAEKARKKQEEENMRKEIESNLRPRLEKEIENRLRPQLTKKIEEEISREYEKKLEFAIIEARCELRNEIDQYYKEDVELKDRHIDLLNSMVKRRDEQITSMKEKESEAKGKINVVQETAHHEEIQQGISKQETILQEKSTVSDKDSRKKIVSFFKRIFGKNR